MPRTTIFSDVLTFRHPTPIRRRIDFARLPPDSDMLRRVYPDFAQVVRAQPIAHVGVHTISFTVPQANLLLLF